MNSQNPPCGSSNVYKTTGKFCGLDTGSPSLTTVIETQGALESRWDLRHQLSLGLCSRVGMWKCVAALHMKNDHPVCQSAPLLAGPAEGGIIYSGAAGLVLD